MTVLFACFALGSHARAGELHEDLPDAKDRALAPAELDLSYKTQPRTASSWTKPGKANPLAAGIVQSLHTGWFERGIQGSIEAVIECQRGDHPGGGLGLLSIPSMRASAPSDHCRRL